MEKEGLNLGERLKICRSRADLTQEQLAQRIGVTRGAVAMWEASTTAPKITNIIKIAEITNSSLGWLMNEQQLELKDISVKTISGWRCPSCAKIYSPLVSECPRC